MKAAATRDSESGNVISRSLTLRRLEWTAILAPLVFLALYYYLMLGPAHGVFHSLWGFLLMVALLGAAERLPSPSPLWTWPFRRGP